MEEHPNQPAADLYTSNFPPAIDNLSLGNVEANLEWSPVPLTASSSRIQRRPSLSSMTGLLKTTTRSSGNSWNTSRSTKSTSSTSSTAPQAGPFRHRTRRPSTIIADLGRGLMGQRTAEHGAEESFRDAGKHGAWLRKIRPFRKEQVLIEEYSDKILRDDSFYSSTPAPVPSYIDGGAAARAAAAAINESNPHLSPDSTRSREFGNDSESGIGIDLNEKSSEEQPRSTRKDPAKALPGEIFAHTLTFLDAQSLHNCFGVNRSWHNTAKDPLVWRSLFARDYGLVHISGIPRCHTGGLGYGRNAKEFPDQNWEAMYKARFNIASNWRDGKANAIYLEGHTDTVYCIQYDENKAITGSRDRTLRVWDIATWKCIKVIGTPKPSIMNGPTSPVPHITRGMTPTRTYTRYAKECKLVPQQHSPDFTHSGSILCIQFDKEIMVTGSSDTTVMVWDMKDDYNPFMRLRRHTSGVLDVCFDDKYIISCSKDSTICIWSRQTGELLRQLAGHRGPVNAVQLRDRLLVSASGDGGAKLWDLTTGICIREYLSKDRGLACVEFSPDANTIYAGGNDCQIYQFDSQTKEVLHEFRGHEALVRSLHLDYINDRIVTGSYDHSIQVYDTNFGHRIIKCANWTTSWILSARSDYRYIIATSQDRRIVVVDFGGSVANANLLRGEP